jgi:hypothetical protein
MHEIIESEESLRTLAGIMRDTINDSAQNIVSRYSRKSVDTVSYKNGRRYMGQSATGTLNRELMNQQIYNSTGISDLSPSNLREVGVQLDLCQARFNFEQKGFALPTNEQTFFEAIPSNITMYDAELKQFTIDHPEAAVARNFSVTQQVIVNSQGGLSIQSIPTFSISYQHGYEPMQTNRDVTVVVNSEQDIRRLPSMIKYLSDPTPDKRIQGSASFSEAFDHLYKISRLQFGSLPEAGIPLSQLYDVVMITGVPIHEIFGHHFEEPIRYLHFGESGTFKLGQSHNDRNLIMEDDPRRTADGFRLLGFTNIDAYGRPREKRTHIKDGEIVGFLGGEYTDHEKIGQFMHVDPKQFRGGSLQFVGGCFPQNRMTCTVLDGKPEDVDLEGKIVVVSHNGETNLNTKTYKVIGDECYVIRNGEPQRIIPLNVTGGINQALANLVLLNDWTYITGACSKPDPIVGSRATMPVSQLTRSQIWQGQQVYPKPINEEHLRILQR